MRGRYLERAGTYVALLALLWAFASSGIALARGELIVQESGGSPQRYHDVSIRGEWRKSLAITSADGKGTLVLDQAACSYVGQIARCLLYGASLRQGGQSKPINVDRGTAYLNLTDEPQTLPLSSERLPPQGVVMALTTKIGTLISLKGTIDQVTGR